MVKETRVDVVSHRPSANISTNFLTLRYSQWGSNPGDGRSCDLQARIDHPATESPTGNGIHDTGV